MSNLFWLTDDQWRKIEPFIPMTRPGPKPKRNREILSGILHVQKTGCRWQDCPKTYGPHTTVYNRFNRWSKAGIWQKIADSLVIHDALDVQCIDSTTAKAHRCSAGAKGGPMRRRLAAAGVDERPKSMPLSIRTDGLSHSI